MVVAEPFKGGCGRRTLSAACLRVCIGGRRRMEGKGETRLRNEQASENKSNGKIPHRATKRQKNKRNKTLFFPTIFRKNVLSAFRRF